MGPGAVLYLTFCLNGLFMGVAVIIYPIGFLKLLLRKCNFCHTLIGPLIKVCPNCQRKLINKDLIYWVVGIFIVLISIIFTFLNPDSNWVYFRNNMQALAVFLLVDIVLTLASFLMWIRYRKINLSAQGGRK
jgi:hypothetical protein